MNNEEKPISYGVPHRSKNFMVSRPRKRFAQHWLRSDKILNQIVAAAQLKKSDRLLEIGPGTGILTRRLLPEVQGVVAVEIDRDLCKKLVKSLGAKNNFLLLQGDILTLNLEEHLSNFPTLQKPNKVVANIPYNITGPILEKLLGKIAQPAQSNYESIVLLVQKEVAQRLVAKPHSKAFGALSVRVQYLAVCQYICDVPAKAFYPPPKVDSAVVRLQPQIRENPASNPQLLETIVKVGFSSKRKMLRNNLKSLFDSYQASPATLSDRSLRATLSDRLTSLLEQLKVNPQARGEDLSVQQWIALSNQLHLLSQV